MDPKGFYIKIEGREREQDSGETERECVRGRALRQEGGSIGNKTKRYRENKHVMEICD